MVLDAQQELTSLRENDRLRRLVTETGRVLAEARKTKLAQAAAAQAGGTHARHDHTAELEADPGVVSDGATPGPSHGGADRIQLSPGNGVSVDLTGGLPAAALGVSPTGADLTIADLAVARPALADGATPIPSATGTEDLLDRPLGTITPSVAPGDPVGVASAAASTPSGPPVATPGSEADGSATAAGKRSRRGRLTRASTASGDHTGETVASTESPVGANEDPVVSSKPEVPDALAELVAASQDLLSHVAGLAGWYSDAVAEDGYVSTDPASTAMVLAVYVSRATERVRSASASLPRGLVERAHDRQARLALTTSIARLEHMAEAAHDAQALLSRDVAATAAAAGLDAAHLPTAPPAGEVAP